MPENEYELRPVGVRYICDKCNEGAMEQSSNVMLLTDPPQFTHKCSNCEEEKNFTVKYPFVRYRAP